MPSAIQLQDFHDKNGHLTEFAGFTLPLWFRGIIPESLAVRNAVGIFDVSHMGRALLRGKDSQKLLDRITTNDVGALKIGQGHYSLICNQEGGIKDDVLVSRLKNQEYMIVYNAGNRSKSYDWMIANARDLDVEVQDVSDSVAMFAVQGPRARQLVQSLSRTDLTAVPRFACAPAELSGVNVLISRTGYTGEDGFEIFVWNTTRDNPKNAQTVWDAILETGRLQGLEPCGLGARDLLRLEAGLCLYGSDMDEQTNPFEARLGFVVKLHKDFIGKERLQEIRDQGTPRIRVGLATERRVIPRHGFHVALEGKKVGSVTSGTLSPLLNTGIALAYVGTESSQEGTRLHVQIRDRWEPAKIVKPPFYDTTRFGYTRKT